MLNTKVILKKLEDHFREYEEQFEFLRWIDEAAINDNLSLEDIFTNLYFNFKKTFKEKRIGIYSISKNHWLPFKFADVMQTKRADKPFIPQNFELPEEVRKGEVIITKYQQSHVANLFIPIIFHENELILIVLQNDLTEHEPTLINDDIIPFAKDVAKRISILIQYKEDKRTEKVKDDLITAFFEHQLRSELTSKSTPNEYWGEIADFIALFLPDWRPFKIDPPPLVQILTYNEGDRYMTLRPTKDNYNSIPLKVDDTICGLLIEQKKDVLLVNPAKEYSHRYKAYLFGANIPKSELVIAVRYDNSIIALFNLEHMDENIFHIYHISLLQKVANILAPFIKALLLQDDIQRSKEISLIYVMTDLLGRIASTHRHKIGNLLLESRTMIWNLEEAIGENQEIHEYLSNLTKFINEFQYRTNSFLKDLPDYVNYGPIDICQQINEAISEFDPEALKTKEKIFIEFYPLESNPSVYASPLLREHIYNLLRNSLDAMQDFIAKNRIREGKIIIKMHKEKVKDAYEKETSPPRIYVQIDDNGGGVPEEVYPHIEKFGFTTKRERGGTGFGLPAAREYMRFIDGDLETQNDLGKGFSVKFYLQEYDPNCHKELKFGHKRETKGGSNHEA